jgi:type 1 glutamine amidotransferase
MRIYIWAGLKSHLPGQHDYPQFLADWSKILTERGAIVDGALHAPRASDLDNTDVVIIYKGDAGYLGDDERAALGAYVKRGGGLVSFHDSLCGPDPVHFAGLVGGAKKHGEVNYTLDAPVPYTVVDGASPIMKGMSNFTLYDEAFYNMTWAKDPGIQVLATTAIAGTPSAINTAQERKRDSARIDVLAPNDDGRALTYNASEEIVEGAGEDGRSVRRRIEHALQGWPGNLGKGRADLGLLRRRHPFGLDGGHAGLADAAQ